MLADTRLSSGRERLPESHHPLRRYFGECGHTAPFEEPFPGGHEITDDRCVFESSRRACWVVYRREEVRGRIQMFAIVALNVARFL